MGWFAHPIFSAEGDYPQIMKDRIGNISAKQGFKKSRLPSFTEGEVQRIKSTADFFGLNTYSARLVTKNNEENATSYDAPSNAVDSGVIVTINTAWPSSEVIWLQVIEKNAP